MSQATRMLLSEGLITRSQHDKAAIDRAGQGGTMGYHLVRVGAITSEELLRFFRRRFPIPHRARALFTDLPDALVKLIPTGLARAFRIVPLELKGGKLIIGLTDPSSTHAIDETSHMCGLPVEPNLLSEADATWALEHYYGPKSIRSTPVPNNPIPLTSKTSDPPAIQPEPQKIMPIKPEKAPVQTSHGSIEEALKAIPLVNKKAAPIPLTTKSEQPASSAHPQNLSTTEEQPVVDSSPEKAFDSWSNPFFEKGPDPLAETSTPKEATTPQETRDNSSSWEPGPSDVVEARPKTVEELQQLLSTEPNRRKIISLALEALNIFSARAAFFTVKKSEIRGFDIRGELTSREAVRALWVPASTNSTLGRVASKRQIYLGPLDNSQADLVLAAALGGRPPQVLIIPVMLRNRTAGLMFADKFIEVVPDESKLEILAATVSGALTRLLRR